MIDVIEINTNASQEVIDITEKINERVRKSQVKDGICFIYSPHTTSAISINEGADPTVKLDIINKLNKVIEIDDDYLHSEGNSHAHIKSVLSGNSVFVFIENARLVLGRWQAVYFIEFDGPRKREVWVKILDSSK